MLYYQELQVNYVKANQVNDLTLWLFTYKSFEGIFRAR